MNLAKYTDLMEGRKSINEFSRDELIELIALMEEIDKREDHSGHAKWFVPGTPYGIDLLPKHRAFFKATKMYKEVLFLGGNRTGKTTAGAMICSILATGRYPDWWDGVVYDGPVSIWAVGQTTQSTRDIVQAALMGPVGAWGTGMIPKDCIGKTVSSMGAGSGLDTVRVKHVKGGESIIGFKTYKQDVKSFTGMKKELVWLDEPAPGDIENECLMRTVVTNSPVEGPANGRMIRTQTPKFGLTRSLADFLSDCDLLADTDKLAGLDIAKALMDKERSMEEDEPIKKIMGEKSSHRAAVAVGWDDVPWVKDEEKETALASTPPHLRDAVSKGIPSIGQGAVYPIPLSEVLLRVDQCPEIQPHWKRCYGLDVGSRVTAAVFIAHDPDNDIVYVTGEHYVRDQPKEVHASRIRDIAKDWMPGFIDPASNQTSQTDRKTLMSEYIRLGLKVKNADNAKNEGIQRVWSRLSQGKLKFFPNTPMLQNEYLLYRYDENESNPQPVKNADHALDALRYAVMSLNRASTMVATRDWTTLPTSNGPKRRRYNV